MEGFNFMGIKIDNHVSVGHIFTTIAAICAGIFAFANAQNDIKNVKQDVTRLEKRIDLQEVHAEQQQIRTDNQFEKIQEKVDKIYEVVVNNSRK